MLGGLAAAMIGCTGSAEPAPMPEPLIDVPPGFPEQVIPEDNQPTQDRVALGKALFASKAFSSDYSLACITCHDPNLAFTDSRVVSVGVEGRLGTRNAPSLANVGYLPYYLREGSVPTLEMQVLVPIQEHNEFDMNILDVVERLKVDTAFEAMSLRAYGRQIDPFVVTRAIACYERTLVSGRSRYDLYAYSGQTLALDDTEKRGMDLFFSDRTSCHTCHGGLTFTNHTFNNNGLYAEYRDPGRYRLTDLETDRGVFKTPSLRNAAITAPYMHDGSIGTLEAVVAHYNSGGVNHKNKSLLVRPLNLSQREQQELVKFLLTLTDHTFMAKHATTK